MEIMLKRRLKLTKGDKGWAKAVKDRDEWACVICGSTTRPNAHHLIVRENHLTKHDVMNGITLCPKHHFFDRKISAHNNPIGFWVWLCEHRPEQVEYCKTKMKEILENEN